MFICVFLCSPSVGYVKYIYISNINNIQFFAHVIKAVISVFPSSAVVCTLATSSYGTTTIKAVKSFSAPPSLLSALNPVSETHASEESRLKLVLESGDYDSAETLVLQTVSDFYGRSDIAEFQTNMNKLDLHMSLVHTLVNHYITVGEIPRLVTLLYRMQV